MRKDGRYWPKKVTLGKRNDNDVLVLAGLKTGQVLAEEKPPVSLIGSAPPKGSRDSGTPGQPRTGGLLSLLPWRLFR